MDWLPLNKNLERKKDFLARNVLSLKCLSIQYRNTCAKDKIQSWSSLERKEITDKKAKGNY